VKYEELDIQDPGRKKGSQAKALFLFRVWGTKDYCKAGFPTEKSSYKVI
jgi:hypothetical protein